MLRTGTSGKAKKITATGCVWRGLPVLRLVVCFSALCKVHPSRTLSRPQLPCSRIRAALTPAKSLFRARPGSCYSFPAVISLKERSHMEWVTPQHQEIDLNCEI